MAGGLVVAAVIGVGVGLALVVWGLRLRSARQARHPRTLVYDVESGRWVAVSPRWPRMKV